MLLIKLHGKRISCLFKSAWPRAYPRFYILRLVANEAYSQLGWDSADVRCKSMRTQDPIQQQSFWLNATQPEFKAVRGRKGDEQLPPFFQNLLPESVFRRFVADETTSIRWTT